MKHPPGSHARVRGKSIEQRLWCKLRASENGMYPRELRGAFPLLTSSAVRNSILRLKAKGCARSEGCTHYSRVFALGNEPEDQRGLAEATRIAAAATFERLNSKRKLNKRRLARGKPKLAPPASILESILRQPWTG